MMRKDVKIGFAIGGVLLAVLLVYVALTSGPPAPPEVSLVTDNAQPAPAGAAAPNASNPEPGKPADRAAADPFRSEPAAPANGSATGAQQPAPADDKWSRALSTGELGLMVTSTPQPDSAPAPADATTAAPTPAPAASVPAGTSGAAGTPAPVNPGDNASTAMPTGAAAPTPSPAPAPAGAQTQSPTIGAMILASSPATQSTGARTHVVQPNETFASIAQMAYGNASYYPHIMRANPNVNPKKIKPGMTIVLPDVSQVVARDGAVGADAAVAPAAAQVPPGNPLEYRVQLNDSLYKISLKLYGRADKVDAIYQLNKQTIGDNPGHLKMGMILKLPEAPTNSTASR